MEKQYFRVISITPPVKYTLADKLDTLEQARGIKKAWLDVNFPCRIVLVTETEKEIE